MTKIASITAAPRTTAWAFLPSMSNDSTLAFRLRSVEEMFAFDRRSSEDGI
jgi:hypothetical protein